MTLVDTNVIAELSKPTPNPTVVRWLDENEPGMWISAITVAELRISVAGMPDGKRKEKLSELIDELLVRFGKSPVAFDRLAADEYARIVSSRRKRGRPIEVGDALIAATAVVHNLVLATLNPKDFEEIDGLKVVDPAA